MRVNTILRGCEKLRYAYTPGICPEGMRKSMKGHKIFDNRARFEQETSQNTSKNEQCHQHSQEPFQLSTIFKTNTTFWKLPASVLCVFHVRNEADSFCNLVFVLNIGDNGKVPVGDTAHVKPLSKSYTLQVRMLTALANLLDKTVCRFT